MYLLKHKKTLARIETSSVPLIFICTLNLILFSCGKDETDIEKTISDYSQKIEETWTSELEEIENEVFRFRDEEVNSQSNLPSSYLVVFRYPQSEHPNLKWATDPKLESQIFSSVQSFKLKNSTDVIDQSFLIAVYQNQNTKESLVNEEKKPNFFSLQGFKDLQQDVNHIFAVHRFLFKNERSAKNFLLDLKDDSNFFYSEPDYNTPVDEALNTLTNNPYTGLSTTYDAINQTWMQGIRLSEAFTKLSQSNSAFDDPPVIAVMDTGVDYEHDQLRDQMWVNENLGSAGCDQDQYGCNTSNLKGNKLGTGDVFPNLTSGAGESCPGTSDGCDRACCHGTHVAGIIAAEPKSGSSIAGICPFCKIMAIRIVGSNSTGASSIADSSIIGGLKYTSRFLNQSGDSLVVRIINASFGKFQRSKTTNFLIRALAETGRGTIVIGAAGNEDTMKMQYPAAYKDSIAVASLSFSGSTNSKTASSWIRLKRSNYGRWVDIAAPGNSIISTVPGGNGAEPKTGTSMAAPMVSGVAGLILSANPGISIKELRSILINTANPSLYSNEINSNYYTTIKGETAPTPMLGSGIVDAAAAIEGKSSSNVPAAKALDRVTPGCGTVTTPSKKFNFLIFLIVPLFASLLFLKISFNSKFESSLNYYSLFLKKKE